MKYNINSELYKKYVNQQLNTWAKSKPIKDWRTDMRGDPKSNRELVRLTEKFCSPKNDESTALDLGAGEGYHSVDLINMGYRTVGIELSSKRVADAHKFGRTYVQQGDMHQLPYNNESFDLVFAHEVIEHCADINTVLSEIYRVLKKGGKYSFSLPAEGHWNPKKLLKNQLENFDWSTGDNHFLKITAQDFWELLHANKLTNFKMKLYTLDSIIFKGEWTPGCKIKINFRPHLFIIGEKK
jgi:SAM-dependent methyltransferase